MRRRALLATSLSGFLAALASSIVLLALYFNSGALPEAFWALIVVPPLGSLVAGALAGIASLGSVLAHHGIVAIAATCLAIASLGFLWVPSVLNWPVQSAIIYPDGPLVNWGLLIEFVIAVAMYLVAALLYARASRGAHPAARVPYLVLLLLSVIPVLCVVGLAGFVFSAGHRKAEPVSYASLAP